MPMPARGCRTMLDLILGVATAIGLALYLIHVLCRPERY
ncbi:MAG: potassium-transporting ATPase subunit F [Niveispirillum sp.]